MNDRNRAQKNGRGGQSRNGRNNSPKGGSKRKSRGRSRSKKVDPLKYWGDRELLTIPETFVLDTPDTSVVATSLGRPPIPGQENASKHYLSLVYDRAAALAVALAAAGDIQNMAANAELYEEDYEDNDDVDGNRADDVELSDADSRSDDRDESGEVDVSDPASEDGASSATS
ncbi:MAG: hypothetical protein ACR2PK_15055 [Acidimicrobiales bacterium]